MKTIVTMTLNPAIDKSASVDHVVAERKLYCKPPYFRVLKRLMYRRRKKIQGRLYSSRRSP
jgi:hypothetical protein